MKTNNINVNDLNGLEDIKLKVITKTLQEPNPAKFSQICEDLFNSINPETFISWSVNTMPMPTNQGIALIYVGILQFWGTEQEHRDWLEQMKRDNLFIKP